MNINKKTYYYFFITLLTSLLSFSIQAKTAHDFIFTLPSGEQLPLKRYQGKVILLVNTASKCGFKGQLGDLQSLSEIYQERGLIVLGVPSRDFGGQEFLNPTETLSFAEEHFHITFPLTAVTAIKGDNAHPFYRWAREAYPNLPHPSWNFHKYLISKNGELVAAFSTRTKPTSLQVVNTIERELTS